jgi:hypothetical protein
MNLNVFDYECWSRPSYECCVIHMLCVTVLKSEKFQIPKYVLPQGFQRSMDPNIFSFHSHLLSPTPAYNFSVAVIRGVFTGHAETGDLLHHSVFPDCPRHHTFSSSLSVVCGSMGRPW